MIGHPYSVALHVLPLRLQRGPTQRLHRVTLVQNISRRA